MFDGLPEFDDFCLDLELETLVREEFSFWDTCAHGGCVPGSRKQLLAELLLPQLLKLAQKGCDIVPRPAQLHIHTFRRDEESSQQAKLLCHRSPPFPNFLWVAQLNEAVQVHEFAV